MQSVERCFVCKKQKQTRRKRVIRRIIFDFWGFFDIAGLGLMLIIPLISMSNALSSMDMMLEGRITNRFS